MEKLPPLPKGIKMLTTVESERLNAMYPRKPHILPPSPEECPLCKGTKQFKWYDAANNVAQYQCSCIDQWIMHRYFMYRGLNRRYQTLGWRDFVGDPFAKEAAQAYIANMDSLFNAGVGLYLWGTIGTGKTLLGSLILKAMMAAGYDGFFTTFVDLINQQSLGHSSREDREWLISGVVNAEVLLIDDPGREQAAGERQADYMSSVLDEVIRKRVSMRLPTIITSNDSLDTFQRRYNSNILSLVEECSSIIEVTGADYRGTSDRALMRETVELGLSRPVVIS